MKQANMQNSIQIASAVVNEIFENTATTIVDRLFTQMRPGFVKK